MFDDSFKDTFEIKVDLSGNKGSGGNEVEDEDADNDEVEIDRTVVECCFTFFLDDE